jgi:hypothetical protein
VSVFFLLDLRKTMSGNRSCAATESTRSTHGMGMPPEIISIGQSVYQLRLAPRELPLSSTSESVRRTRLPRIGPRGRLERPSGLLPNRRPIGGPSPSVLIHQSYLARVTSAPVISERLADSYRTAWMAREFGKFEASMQAAPPPEEGVPEPAEEAPWDPDMLHEHVMGCLQARAAALRALARFAGGILPERALSHRHLHPLRAKLRSDLSQHFGAARLATLDLGEALQAWEESAGEFARPAPRDASASLARCAQTVGSDPLPPSPARATPRP